MLQPIPQPTNLTGPITSVGNATSVADQTGTGSKFVMQSSPTLTTPNLGTPSALVATNASGTAASLTAGNSTNAAITNDDVTNSDMPIAWVTTNTGNLPIKVSSGKMTLNPGANRLRVPIDLRAIDDAAYLYLNFNWGVGPVFSNGDLSSTSNVRKIIWSDVGIGRAAAGVLQVNNGSSGVGALACGQPGTTTIGLAIQSIASRTAPLLQLQNSAGASIGNVGGCIFDHFADSATTHTDGTEDVVYTDTTVADTLAVNGDKITFKYVLTLVGSLTATRRVRIYFAGLLAFDSGSITIGATGGVVVFDGYIARKTSTTCRSLTEMRAYGSATLLGLDAATYTPEATLTGLTLSGTNILKITGACGTGSSAGDITGMMGVGYCQPAA